MRNYIKLFQQVVTFNEQFTGQPIGCVAVGEDEDDCVELMYPMISDAQAQFPGSTFDPTETSGPIPVYFELIKHVLARALFETIALNAALPMINAGNFLLVSYKPGARAEFDLSPDFFAEFIQPESPRKEWSHGH